MAVSSFALQLDKHGNGPVDDLRRARLLVRRAADPAAGAALALPLAAAQAGWMIC